MITPFDDYPIHQTAAPVAYPATGDRGYYDGYFFNGYDRDGEFFFAITMGIYPNRKVTDASFAGVAMTIAAVTLAGTDAADLLT